MVWNPYQKVNLSWLLKKKAERFQRMKNWQSDIDTKGCYEWHVTVARKPTIGRIYLKDLQDFMSWDTSIVWNEFPAHVDVLSIHGIQDQTVPV